jgi:IS30 family transposase
LNTNPRLRIEVAAKLELNWSPEQVSGWLKRAHPTDPEMHVSTETIYRSLFIQARGALKKELVRHLRSGRVQRRGKHRVYAKSSKSIPDAVSIRERPADSDDRAVPGHWEGDLLYGANNSYIATLVERQSRFALLVPVKGRDTGNVVTALARAVRKLPVELRRSLTWDRGTEMAHHADFTIATNVKVFFCDPHSPWQRGSNENTNGLLRQYFPKTFDFNAIKAPQLQAVALQLNQRPRKTLGFLSPAEKLAEVLH